MKETISFQVDRQLWQQLLEIGEVTGENPADVALAMVRASTEARVALMVQEAEAERFRLESELTVITARLSGLNGSPKASQRPQEPSPPGNARSGRLGITEATRGILGSDRKRSWSTREVMAALGDMGFDADYNKVNALLHYLVHHGEARNPVVGQFTWTRRPNKG